jgi:hypothetical protein
VLGVPPAPRTIFFQVQLLLRASAAASA